MVRLPPHMHVTAYEIIDGDDLSIEETSDNISNFIGSEVSDDLPDEEDVEQNESHPQIPFTV